MRCILNLLPAEMRVLEETISLAPSHQRWVALAMLAQLCSEYHRICHCCEVPGAPSSTSKEVSGESSQSSPVWGRALVDTGQRFSVAQLFFSRQLHPPKIFPIFTIIWLFPPQKQMHLLSKQQSKGAGCPLPGQDVLRDRHCYWQSIAAISEHLPQSPHLVTCPSCLGGVKYLEVVRECLLYVSPEQHLALLHFIAL